MSNLDFRRFRDRSRTALVALLSPQWLTVLTIFLILYGPFLYKQGWEHRYNSIADLPSFYAASVSVFRDGKSPYDQENLLRLMPDVRMFPYLYPPPSLLIFFPFSALTYAQACRAVLVVNHLLFLALIWAIPLRLLRARPQGLGVGVLALCMVYSLTFSPVVVTLNLGQVNILLLAFLVLFWLLARDGHARSAGLFLALAIVLKTYPLIIIPMLILIGRRREGLYAGAWLGIATVVSVVVLPGAIWHDWLTDVLPTGGYSRTPAGLFSPAAVWNQNINGFFARAFTESRWSHPLAVDPGLARLLTYGAAGLATVATGIAVWRSRLRADSLDRMMLVTLPLTFLIAPFSWEHHLVYLLPVALLLLTCRSSSGLAARLLFHALCLAAAVLISSGGLRQLKFYGVAVLWGLCVLAVVNKNVELSSRQSP